MNKIWSLVVARNREFLRDRATLAWNFVFPLLVIFGVAVIFAGPERAVYKVGVINGDAAPSAQITAFLETRYVDFIPMPDADEAMEKVQRHSVDMAVDLAYPPRYWINETNQKGYFLERMLLGAGSRSTGAAGDVAPRNSADAAGTAVSSTLPSTVGFTKEVLQGREIRYVDWLLPGVLAMNMMFSCLFGVGYVIVRYRKGGILRRLKVAPITALQFISAQMISRLILVMIVIVLLYVGTDIVLDFYVVGSLFNLFLMFTLGAMCLNSLGLLIASRTHSQELAGGLLNFFTWPMMFLSGVWFSLEGADPWIQWTAKLFPLTHIIDGSRKIMIDGAGLLDVIPEMTILAVMTVVFLVTTAYLFRWE